MNKVERIREELGSVAKVLEARAARIIGKEGMRRDGIDGLAASIEDLSVDERQRVAEDELEDARLRQDKLRGEIDVLRTRLQRSSDHIGLTAPQFRETLTTSLKLAGASAITAADRDDDRAPGSPRQFLFPVEDRALANDPGWTAALDTLRERRRRGEKIGEWRRRAPIRPIAFEDTGQLGNKAVHLHLEHRVVHRLLSRFTAQGLIHHDLSKGPA